MNELTPRLQAIAELVGQTDVAADIGCDHGILSVFLAQSGRAKIVLASDISAPSLEKAKKLAKERDCRNVRLFVGNGFDALLQKPDTAILAGFGGRNMAALLTHPYAQTRLILQPMCDSFALYDALSQNGFCIQSVRIVQEDRRFYEIVVASPGKAEPFDHVLPPPDKLIQDKASLAFLHFRQEQNKRLLQKAQNGRDTQARQEELIREMTIIKEMLSSWQR